MSSIATFVTVVLPWWWWCCLGVISAHIRVRVKRVFTTSLSSISFFLQNVLSTKRLISTFVTDKTRYLKTGSRIVDGGSIGSMVVLPLIPPLNFLWHSSSLFYFLIAPTDVTWPKAISEDKSGCRLRCYLISSFPSTSEFAIDLGIRSELYGIFLSFRETGENDQETQVKDIEGNGWRQDFI